VSKQKQQTTPKQPIKPDFSALIAKQQKQEKQQQPAIVDKPAAVAVVPAQVETAAEQEQQRQQRLEQARQLQRQQQTGTGTGTAATDTAAEETALEPLVYNAAGEGRPICQPDTERQIAILQQAIEQGESIPVIAKRYGVSRQAIQQYITQAKEEIELNSQLLDIKLVESLDTKIKEIVTAVDKTKLDKATVRDLAIAAGIFIDKRRELLGPKQSGGNLRLRASFHGEGAIEVITGDQ